MILQIGEKFIGNYSTLSFIADLKYQLFRVRQYLPNTYLIVSEFTPCLLWSRKEFVYKNKIRIRLNRMLEKCLPSLSGSSFRHRDFEELVPGFFLEDGITLSSIGLDLFNIGLQDMVELGLRHLGGPSV